jgi:hypothetical protein
MATSEYLEQQVLGHLLRSATWTKPFAIYLALLTALPTDQGGLVEVAAADYARMAVGPDDAVWILRDPDQAHINAATLLFSEPVNDWGTLTGVALFDAATGGNLLVWSALAAPKVVSAGGPAVMFQPGALVFAMNDG